MPTINQLIRNERKRVIKKYNSTCRVISTCRKRKVKV